MVVLANRAFRGTGAVQSWNVESSIRGDRLSEAVLRADLAGKPDAQLLVHRIDGALQACVQLEPGTHGRWHLGLLAIDPALQTGGMGSLLLTAAEANAAAQGATHIDIAVVNVRDTLIAWYERRGYVRTGATEPWPYGDERFGTPVRDDLAFVLLDKAL